jgi:thiamine phosphate synthase YjbQ (UPF0047 family)
MKVLTEHLWFEVPNRVGFVNITRTVEDLVKRSQVQEGLCLVNAMQIRQLISFAVEQHQRQTTFCR